MKIQYFICIFFLHNITLFSQPEADDFSWKNKQSLTWSNYKGKAPRDTQMAAFTSSKTRYSVEESGSYLIVMLETYFNPHRSWVRDDARKDVLLKHEQLHFDISELYRRKCLAELKQIPSLKQSNAEAWLKNIFSKYSQLCADFQSNYDADTDHGLLRDKQIWYEQFIEGEIAKSSLLTGNTCKILLLK